MLNNRSVREIELKRDKRVCKERERREKERESARKKERETEYVCVCVSQRESVKNKLEKLKEILTCLHLQNSETFLKTPSFRCL